MNLLTKYILKKTKNLSYRFDLNVDVLICLFIK